MSELENVLKEKVEMLEKIRNYQNKIKELTDQIESLNKKLYKICNHKWERDYSSCDDLSKKYCEQCGLRDYNMYR